MPCPNNDCNGVLSEPFCAVTAQSPKELADPVHRTRTRLACASRMHCQVLSHGSQCARWTASLACTQCTPATMTDFMAIHLERKSQSSLTSSKKGPCQLLRRMCCDSLHRFQTHNIADEKTFPACTSDGYDNVSTDPFGGASWQ